MSDLRFLTDYGQKIYAKAKELKIDWFYDYHSGVFTFTYEDFLKYKNEIREFKKTFYKYFVIVEDIEIYKEGNPYLEQSKSEFVYFLTDWVE